MRLNYDGVKEKPETLRAMTSLDRNEFELLCLSFSQVWEKETRSSERDASKGGRKPILLGSKTDFFLFCFISRPIRFKKC